ncbi:MAG TPA: FAD-dependent oxidoreductase, partial [Achromobacter sp.]
LALDPDAGLAAALDALAAATGGALHPLRVLKTGADALQDTHGQLRQRYGAQAGAVYLLRPDGYVLGRWIAPPAATLRAALQPYYPSIALDAPKEEQA